MNYIMKNSRLLAKTLSYQLLIIMLIISGSLYAQNLDDNLFDGNVTDQSPNEFNDTNLGAISSDDRNRLQLGSLQLENEAYINSHSEKEVKPAYSCDNDAGLMQSANSMVCGGNSVFVKEAFSVLDESSVKAYIMHQNKEFDGRNYMKIQKSSRFVSPGEDYHNEPVYISAIVGPANENDLPNMADPCTVWTPYGAYVVFFDPVTVSITEETCIDGQFYIDLEITGGVGGRSSQNAYRTITDGNTHHQNVSTNEMINFGPYINGDTYTIEAFCAKGCVGGITNSVSSCDGLLNKVNYALNNNIVKIRYTDDNKHFKNVEVYNLNAQLIPTEISIDFNQSEVLRPTNKTGFYIIKTVSTNNEVDFIKILW